MAIQERVSPSLGAEVLAPGAPAPSTGLRGTRSSTTNLSRCLERSKQIVSREQGLNVVYYEENNQIGQ